MYINYCGVSTNVNIDDVNRPCYIEDRDKRERIHNTITDKLNLENNLEGFSFSLSHVTILRLSFLDT